LASRAANGSLTVPRIGEGLGLVAFTGTLAVGLPRRIGTTSGMTCCCGGGGANTAPTTGGDTTLRSGDAGSC
jgi:hypothetical protein